MAERDVVFRADASRLIGSGHVMRCLTLAEELARRGRRCSFLCRDLDGHLGAAISSRGFPVHMLATPDEAMRTGWLGVDEAFDAAQSARVLAELSPGWAVADHYGLGAPWERRVKVPGCRLLVIDDLADRPHDCDLLLDQTLGRYAADYAGLVPESCTVLAGPRHALLRPEFRALRARSLAGRRERGLRRIMVTMGGVDKDNATALALRVLGALEIEDLQSIDIVMGATAPWHDDVRRLAAAMKVPARVHVDTPRMAELMAEADLVIGAAGTSAWERCCLGVPCIMFVLADNQDGVAKSLAAEGAALSAGRAQAPDAAQRLADALRTVAEPGALAAMSARAAAVTDGRGAARAADAMTAAELAVRRAGPEQCRLIWEWRHAGNASRFYRSAADTPFEDHARWYAKAVNDENRLLYIVYGGDQPLGHVRIDRHDGAPASVGICMAPESRGSGLSGPVLQAALAAARRSGMTKFTAEVHEANAASRQLFERAGFSYSGRDGAFLNYYLDPS